VTSVLKYKIYLSNRAFVFVTVRFMV